MAVGTTSETHAAHITGTSYVAKRLAIPFQLYYSNIYMQTIRNTKTETLEGDSYQIVEYESSRLKQAIQIGRVNT